jgi:pimeloyl-ACP methyl ester carboxylesterase
VTVPDPVTAEQASPGVTLAGPAGAPAIVFVHGTRLTCGMWAAQQAALSAEFRTIAIDLPGHGARARETFTLDGAADVLAASIQAHATGRRAVVVGLSLGGYVAMALAAREPVLVRGLVVSGATAEPVGPRALPFLALAGVMDHADVERFARMNARFFRARYPAAIAEPIIAGGFWPKGGAEALRAIAGERFLPRLAAYPGSTLILNGELDVVFRLSTRTFAAAAVDAHRVLLAGATHLAPLDRPPAFSEAVRRFARSMGAQ